MSEPETQQASPEMQLFFEKLLRLKEYANKRARYLDGYGNIDLYLAWDEVYQRLDEIIKEKK